MGPLLENSTIQKETTPLRYKSKKIYSLIYIFITIIFYLIEFILFGGDLYVLSKHRTCHSYLPLIPHVIASILLLYIILKMNIFWDVIAIGTGRCMRDSDYSEYIWHKLSCDGLLILIIAAIALPILISWVFIIAIFPKANNCPEFVYIYIISRLCYSLGKYILWALILLGHAIVINCNWELTKSFCQCCCIHMDNFKIPIEQSKCATLRVEAV